MSARWVFFRILFFFLLAICTATGLKGRIYAQEASPLPQNVLESCFKYYAYGEVAVHLTTEQPQYQSGDTVTVRGTVVNGNTFPLTNVIVYAHLRRVNGTASFADAGHFLMKRIVIADSLHFLPKETKAVTGSFPLTGEYSDGTYQMQYFVLSSEGFHYSGRPFLEQDMAGTSGFRIEGAPAYPLVYIDPTSLTVNGQRETIRQPVKEFTSQSLTFQVKLQDQRKEKTDVTGAVAFYSFEDTFEELVVHRDTVTFSKERGVASVTFTPPYAGAFVMVISLSDPYVSELKYRFAKKGTQSHSLQLADLGISDFPIQPSSTAHVCFHSPAPQLTPLTTVRLTVLDGKGQTVGKKEFARTHPGEVLALSVPLDQVTTPYDLQLRAEAIWNDGTGEKKKELIKRYSCDLFADVPVDVSGAYDAASRSISVSAVNVCGKPVQEGGGYIQSVKIKTPDGAIQREWYNQPSSVTGLSVSDFLPGRYIAEIVKDEEKKHEVLFTVSAASSSASASSGFDRRILYLIVGVIVILGLFLLFRTRKQKVNSI